MSTAPGSGRYLPDLTMTAAGLRADNRELMVLLRSLLETLLEALGPRVTVKYAHGFFGKLVGDIPYVRMRSRKIRAATVVIDAQEFRIDLEHGTRCEIHQVTPGGIPTDGRKVSLPEWSRTLMAALGHHALAHAEARRSLEGLLTI